MSGTLGAVWAGSGAPCLQGWCAVFGFWWQCLLSHLGTCLVLICLRFSDFAGCSQQQNAVGFHSLGLGVVVQLATGARNPMRCCVGTLACHPGTCECCLGALEPWNSGCRQAEAFLWWRCFLSLVLLRPAVRFEQRSWVGFNDRVSTLEP